MNRLYQWLLIVTFLPLCWLAMQAVHELGHVTAAWATGGRVNKVVLHPLAISRTDTTGSAHRLAVVWAGPVIGVALPLAILGLFKAARWKWDYLAQFFAGFCLIANGAYPAPARLWASATRAIWSAWAVRSGACGSLASSPCRWGFSSGTFSGRASGWDKARGKWTDMRLYARPRCLRQLL